MNLSESLFSTHLVQQAIQTSLRTIDQNLTLFENCFPDDTTQGNRYFPRRARDGFAEGANIGWTTSFWPGMLWLAYELSADEKYRLMAEHLLESFIERVNRQIDLDTHDLGFLYTLSCVVPWRLTQNLRARDAAIRAAEYLMTRFLDSAGIIQAWGNLSDPEQQGRTIVDSLMNMPLLYWASEVTGKTTFATAACRHVKQLREHIVRPNFTTFHTFFWDPKTGQPLRGNTQQGYSDDSCWARGQAWAILGFALNYRYTHDAALLQTAQSCADYFLAHLPADHVACWDLALTGVSEERDSSAAAIAVCGLSELTRWLPAGAQKQRYTLAAAEILTSLMQNYVPAASSASNALLLQGVYDMPKGIGVNEGNLWGDFFYLEALTRALKPNWQPYW